MSNNNKQCNTPEELLQNWVLNLVKHKNIITRDLKETKVVGGDVFCAYKDRQHYYMVVPEMQGIEDVLERKRQVKYDYDTENITVVVLNSENNLKILIANWYRFVSFPELNFIFVNPFSKNEKKWMVNPHFHQRVCDPDSLETGLRSMFCTVDLIDEKTAKKIFT